MKNSWLHYKRGYVVLTAAESSPERFLNICSHHKIPIYNLTIQKDILTMQMDVQDYFRLRPIVRKCHIHLQIKEKHGLPFWIYRSLRHKAFYFGILLFSLLLYVLSSHIWSIQIEGNYRNSTPVILEYLETLSIHPGILKRRISCQDTAAAIRQKFPDITWVSAKIQGSRLFLRVQENLEGTKPVVIESPGMPCDILASASGTVIKMITKRGVPQVFPGDKIKKGDILVRGILEIKDDNQEVIREEHVPAEADILIERLISYEDIVSRNCTRKIYEKDTKTVYGGWIGSYLLTCSFFKTTLEDDQTMEVKYMPLSFTDYLPYPVTILKTVIRTYDKLPAVLSKKEAKQIAEKRIQTFEKNLIEKGVQIYQNNVTIDCNERVCRSKGYFVIREYTGTKTPIEEKTEQETS